MKRRTFIGSVLASAFFMPKRGESFIVNDEIGPPTGLGDNLFWTRMKGKKSTAEWEYWDGDKWIKVDVELTNCKM